MRLSDYVEIPFQFWWIHFLLKFNCAVLFLQQNKQNLRLDKILIETDISMVSKHRILYT